MRVVIDPKTISDTYLLGPVKFDSRSLKDIQVVEDESCVDSRERPHGIVSADEWDTRVSRLVRLTLLTEVLKVEVVSYYKGSSPSEVDRRFDSSSSDHLGELMKVIQYIMGICFLITLILAGVKLFL